MAGIVFLSWYFTIGVIFWKYHSNRIFANDNGASFNEILNNMPGYLRKPAWYCSIAIVILMWPVIQFNRICNWIRKIFTHYSESK